MEISNRKLILGLIIIQLLVTIPFITSFPIDLDEPFSIFYAQQDLTNLFEMFKDENNPPLHFLLLHFWIKFFGIGAFSVRSLSVVFSLIVIPIVFKLSNEIVGKTLSTLVVIMLVFSNYFHYHSMEARVYIMFLLFFVCVAYFLFEIIFNGKNRYIQLVLSATLLLYSHYLSFVVLSSFGIVVLLFAKSISKKQWIYLILSLLSIILLYLPMLILTLTRVGDVSANGTWVSYPHWTEIYGNIIKFINGKFSFMILALMIITLGFVFNGFKRIKELITNKKYSFPIILFLTNYILMYIVSMLFTPVFLDRYLMYLTPILFIVVGVIVKLLIKDSFKKYVFVIILPMILFLNFIPDTNREGDKMAEYVKSQESPYTQVLICPPFYDYTFAYHYNTKLFEDYKGFKGQLEQHKISPVFNFEEIKVLSDTKELFYIDCNSVFLFPDNKIEQKLNENFKRVESKSFKGDYLIIKYIIES